MRLLLPYLLMEIFLQSSKWYAEEPRQTAVVGVELVANLAVLALATVSPASSEQLQPSFTHPPLPLKMQS